MEFEEVVDKRRSVRLFDERDVGEELLLKIVEAASKAPSPGNLQPWHFIVVRNREMIDKIADSTYSGFSEENPPQTWIKTAPALIIICFMKRSVIARYGEKGYVQGLLSIGSAIENLLLAAVNYGLGACWVGGFRKSELLEILKLTSNFEPMAIIPVGYSKKTPNPPPKLPVKEILTMVD